MCGSVEYSGDAEELIRVKKQATQEILRLIEEARGYVNSEVRSAEEAAVRRLNILEDQIRLLLGEPLRKHPCYHICGEHPVKETVVVAGEGEDRHAA